MPGQTVAPAVVGKARSLGYFARFLSDPLTMARALHEAHGPFVLLQFPWSRRSRPAVLLCIANSELYRATIAATEVWRGVKIQYGIKNHASERLTTGMTRMRGARHAHYRRLLAPPLSKPAVTASSPAMAALADEEAASWPRNVPVNLLKLTEHLMVEYSIGLLFGNDRERALPIAETIIKQGAASRMWPGRECLRWMAIAGRQERAILDWAEEKRGDLDAQDILSVIVNNSDETGRPPSPAIIGGLCSFVFGAAFETCQNGLAWTLIMIAQHPQLAGALADEINGALAGGPPTIDRVGSLPLLDAVIKEGLRLFPPVPLLFRKSTIATQLGDVEIPPDTRLIASNHIINRNPDLYAEPDRFRPERWDGLDPSPYDYTVFGAGNRTCPGFIFGIQAMKISLAAILSRHRVTMVPHARIDYRTRITLLPYPDIPVVLRDVAEAPRAVPIRGGIHKLVDLSGAR
jgi:cytochrome P450